MRPTNAFFVIWKVRIHPKPQKGCFHHNVLTRPHGQVLFALCEKYSNVYQRGLCTMSQKLLLIILLFCLLNVRIQQNCKKSVFNTISNETKQVEYYCECKVSYTQRIIAWFIEWPHWWQGSKPDIRIWHPTVHTNRWEETSTILLGSKLSFDWAKRYSVENTYKKM